VVRFSQLSLCHQLPYRAWAAIAPSTGDAQRGNEPNAARAPASRKSAKGNMQLGSSPLASTVGTHFKVLWLPETIFQTRPSLSPNLSLSLTYIEPFSALARRHGRQRQQRRQRSSVLDPDVLSALCQSLSPTYSAPIDQHRISWRL